MRIENLSKTYGGIRAVDDLTLDLPTGEAHALLGANGAGKSTLVKIVAGVVAPDHGVVDVDGSRFTSLTPAESAAGGIRVAHQELAIFPQLTVAEHLVVGRKVSRSERSEYLRRYEDLFDEWGLEIDLSSVVREMSPTLQATVSLVRALEGDARFLILDEPTAALGPREVAGLFGIVRRKVAEGTGVIWVSHRLREVSELCSSATVMRNGAKVYSGPIGHLGEDELAELITAGATSRDARPSGARAGARLPRRVREPDGRAASASSLLSVRNLRLSKSVADVSFDVAPGEVVGLAGLVGAGRTEILEALVGLRPIVDGALELDGQPYRPRSPHEALKRGVMLVPEERASQALFLERDVGFNLASARFRSEGRGRGGWRAQRRSYDETSRELVEALNIRAAGLDAPVSSLSGGNQQKVVLGRVLLDTLTLLLLDEPTRGVDVGARRDFERIIRQLGERGVGVVYVASELGELEHCDRIVVVVEGVTTTEYHPEAGFDEEELTRLCFVPRQAEGALR
jgi:ABC-type sugar transport system ATPase subunit